MTMNVNVTDPMRRQRPVWERHVQKLAADVNVAVTNLLPKKFPECASRGAYPDVSFHAFVPTVCALRLPFGSFALTGLEEAREIEEKVEKRRRKLFELKISPAGFDPDWIEVHESGAVALHLHGEDWIFVVVAKMQDSALPVALLLRICYEFGMQVGPIDNAAELRRHLLPAWQRLRPEVPLTQ